jgi:transposase
MILIPPNRPLYAAIDTVDFRRSFDVLVAVAREQLGLDALRSAVVLFFNRDRTRCKLLFHDGTGVVVLYKRLDEKRYAIPAPTQPGDRSVKIEPRELAVLVAGALKR